MVFSEEERNWIFDSENLKYFEDESNESNDYLRNRVRKTIIPLLKDEGLNPAKVYANFHNIEDIFFEKETFASKKTVPSYLKIDTSSLGNLSLGNLKKLLDIHAEILKLHPFTKKILLELKKELDKNSNFQIQNKEIILWKNPTSDLFLIPKNSSTLQIARVSEIAGKQILIWNNQEKEVLNHYEVGTWKPGLKILKNGIHKEVSEIFRALQIPTPVRETLPILFKNKEPALILFSLWNHKTKDFSSELS